MPVKFTKHALQRIKSRNLSKNEILDILNQPNSVKKNSANPSGRSTSFTFLCFNEFNLLLKINSV